MKTGFVWVDIEECFGSWQPERVRFGPWETEDSFSTCHSSIYLESHKNQFSSFCFSTEVVSYWFSPTAVIVWRSENRVLRHWLPCEGSFASDDVAFASRCFWGDKRGYWSHVLLQSVSLVWPHDTHPAEQQFPQAAQWDRFFRVWFPQPSINILLFTCQYKRLPCNCPLVFSLRPIWFHYCWPLSSWREGRQSCDIASTSTNLA